MAFWRETIVKYKRPLMLKLARAMVEAIHIIKTEKEYAISLFKKNLGVTDPEGLERAYRDHSNVFPEVPIPHRTASRPCSIIMARMYQRPQLRTPRHSLIRAWFASCTARASSNNYTRSDLCVARVYENRENPASIPRHLQTSLPSTGGRQRWGCRLLKARSFR